MFPSINPPLPRLQYDTVDLVEIGRKIANHLPFVLAEKPPALLPLKIDWFCWHSGGNNITAHQDVYFLRYLFICVLLK